MALRLYHPAAMAGPDRPCRKLEKSVVLTGAREISYERLTPRARRGPPSSCGWRPTGRPATIVQAALQQADNNIPNSVEASMSKAAAGRMASDVTCKTVELAGTTGYSEHRQREVGPRLQDPGHSRAPSRSSSWWSRADCWACRRPSSNSLAAVPPEFQ